MTNNDQSAFGHFHPLPSFLYLTVLAAVTVFCTNPVLLGCSFLGGLFFGAALWGRKEFLAELLFSLPAFLLISLFNPLFSHNGATPLFFLNGNPVTLEAILYGADLALMLLSALFWCKSLSTVMTTDKTLYLFGKMIPKLSLVLSMALRFIPLFLSKWKEIRTAQKAMGYYSEKGIVSKIGSSLCVFSALVSWALENSMDTGASMRARGYGLPGRTHFSLFRFSREDGLLLCGAWGLVALTVFGSLGGLLSLSFYPRIEALPRSGSAFGFYILFGLFCFLPLLFECTEALKWKYLKSGI